MYGEVIQPSKKLGCTCSPSVFLAEAEAIKTRTVYNFGTAPFSCVCRECLRRATVMFVNDGAHTACARPAKKAMIAGFVGQAYPPGIVVGGATSR